MHFAIFQYIVIISCGIVIGLTGLYVLLNNSARAVNRWFTVFTTGIALWNVGLSLLFFLGRPIFISLILEGAVILSIGLFFFAKVFPTGKITPLDMLYFVPMAGVTVLVLCHQIISSVSITASGSIIPHNEHLFWIYGVALAAYLLGGMAVLIRKYVGADTSIRVQLRHFLGGIVVLIITGLVCDVALPSMGVYGLNLAGPSASLVFVVATAYSIVRHRLMDIRLVIQRGLVYFTLLVIIVATYVLGLEFLGYLLQRVTDFNSIVSAGITTVLGVFFIEPLRKYFEKITDPIFFKHRYVYPDALTRLSRLLNTTMSQADVIAASSQALKDIFKTSEVSFVLNEQYRHPANPSSGVVLPIVFEERAIGTITLGPKRSGDQYDRQDMQLLETFLNQAAVALEKGRLYEKVEEYNGQLERIVEERTSEVKRIQEEQKRNMIDISHNLQTPLAVIRGELELMQEYSADQGKIVAVKRSLMRVSEFIRQLLHLARLDNSIYDIPFIDLDFSFLVEEQAEYFEVMGYEHRLKVEATIEPHIMMRGNKRLLEEALTNIAQNAIKYRRDDVESCMHIDLKQKDDCIVLTLEDNGIGIEKENLKEIFTRFYRTSRATKKSQGVGLGLSIVQKIVEMHGGTITVKSKVGHGTKFVMTFKNQT